MIECQQPQAHPDRCGCVPEGTERVSSAWLKQLREEFSFYADECQRLRSKVYKHRDLARERKTQLEQALAECEKLRAELSARDALRPIGELIRTQDNRCTDGPLFAVMKKRPIVVSPDHDHDYIEWVDVENEYAVATEARARRLEALFQGGRDAPDGWERFAMKEIDVFVTACFTEQGCRDFLARDGHNHRKPYIYAFGSYRNTEFRAIREWLAALPAPATQGEPK